MAEQRVTQTHMVVVAEPPTQILVTQTHTVVMAEPPTQVRVTQDHLLVVVNLTPPVTGVGDYYI